MAIADIYKKATLVQIPSGYKSGTLYSVVPNTADGDFTVSADADATRVNKDGLIESTVANQARLNYNFIDGVVQPDPHLLLEPTRTNLQVRSEELENAAWSKSNITVTDNDIISPDGGLNGSKLAENTSGTNAYFIDDLYGASGGTYTFSCFLKKGTLKYAGIRALTNNFGNRHFVLLDLEDGSVASTNTLGSGVTWEYNVENYGNGWYRLSVTGSHTSSNVGILISGSNVSNPSYGGAIPSYNANGSGDFYAWGAQVEEGSYPTSYIPTSGTAVTRSVDTCGTSDNNLINNAEGVLFVDFEFSEQGTTSLYQIPIGLFNSGGGGTQRITIDNYSGKLRIYVVSPSGTITVWDTSKSISNVIANQRYRVAIRYKNGDCASYVNGELYKADSGSVSGFDLVKMVFGYANFGNTLMHRGKIYQAMYFNTALTNAELQTLTS